MDDAKWERWAAATGILFFVLLAVSTFIVPASPPKANDSIAKITDYYVKHRKGLLVGGYLSGLALAVFLWFLGSLRSYLRTAEGGTGRVSAVAFGGGILTAAGALASGAAASAIAFKLAGLQGNSAAAVRALFDLSSLAIGFLWFPASVLVAATATVAWRTGAFPKWFAQVSLVAVLLALVGAMSLFVDSGALATGGVIPFITFIVFGLWVLVTSILLVQRVGRPMATATRGPMAPQM